jgi:hypothetical protein
MCTGQGRAPTTPVLFAGRAALQRLAESARSGPPAGLPPSPLHGLRVGAGEPHLPAVHAQHLGRRLLSGLGLWRLVARLTGQQPIEHFFTYGNTSRSLRCALLNPVATAGLIDCATPEKPGA